MTLDSIERAAPSASPEIALPPGVYTIFWHSELADGTVTEDESTFAVEADGGPAEAPVAFLVRPSQQKAA